MRTITRFLAPIFLLLALAPARAETPPIQKYLASLRLGDTMDEIERIYPPTRKWTKFREPGGAVIRIIIERGFSKWMPKHVNTVRLGMKRGRLIHIQLIYDKKESRRKPVGEMVLDLSLIYGEPRRAGDKYFWWDGGRVIAVSNTAIPSGRRGGKELRATLELMKRSYFSPYK